MTAAKIVFIFLAFLSARQSHATDRLLSTTQEKGFFAVGIFGGISESSFLNTTSDFSGYKSNVFGGDLDVQLFGSGAGQFRLFASYLVGHGKNNSVTSDEVKSEETIFGLKIFVNEYIYLSLGAGRGQETLTSVVPGASLALSHALTRGAIGFEFPVSSSFYLGLEASFRSGPIKQSENSGLTENSYYQGGAYVLRIVWSPPSVTNNYSKK